MIEGVALAPPAVVIGLLVAATLVSIAFGSVLALLLAWDLRRDLTAGQQHFLLGLGALVAFSAGGSRVGLAIGPILPLYTSLAIPAIAILVGVPVSFNEIVVSAVVGSGLAAGGAGISRAKALYTIGAWVGSLLLSIVVAYGVLSLLQLV